MTSPAGLALEAAAAHFEAVFSEASAKLAEAAQAFAKAETLAYSKAHPRRTVTFCAAMGTTTLHVSRGGTSYGPGDYQLSGDRADIGEPPAFLHTLQEIDDASDFGKGWLAGPLRYTCKGGRVVSDDSDW